VGDTLPQAPPLQPVPETVQVTPLFFESFVTVAVRACVPAVCTLAVVSDKLTAIAGVGVGVGVGVGLDAVPAQPDSSGKAAKHAPPKTATNRNPRIGLDGITAEFLPSSPFRDTSAAKNFPGHGRSSTRKSDDAGTLRCQSQIPLEHAFYQSVGGKVRGK
jgi:hypothetical protein